MNRDVKEIELCKEEELQCIFCGERKRWLGNIALKVCQLEIEVTVCPRCAEIHTVKDLWRAVASQMIDLATRR